MKQYLPQIMRCPLFENMEQEVVLTMMKCFGGRIVTAQKDDLIFAQGSRIQWFGVVLHGSIQIIRGDIHGAHTIIEMVEQGDMFAEVLAWAGIKNLPCNIVASTDCVLLLMDYDRVSSPCKLGCPVHFGMISSLLQLVSQRNLLLNQKLEIVMKRTTREKLLAYLRHQSQKHPGDSFVIPFDRQSLADFLGVERSAMSTELNKLKRDGLIDFERNVFTLLMDPTNTDV